MKKIRYKMIIVFFLGLSNFIYGTITVPEYIKNNFSSSDDAGVLLNKSREYFEFQKMNRELQEEKQKNRQGIESKNLNKLQESPEGEIKFQVNRFEFSPSEVLKEEELNNIVFPYLKKEISINNLYEIINKINSLYEKKGYVVCKAGLPTQTISNGVVRIVLIEGKTGRILIQGNESTKSSYIRDRIDLDMGTVSNLKELNKSLIWFNGTNDIQLRIELTAGVIPGTTDYILTAYEPERQTGTIFVDNAGSETSGEYRGGISYINKSLFGYRDQLYISGVGSDGTVAGSFIYNFPITKKGTRLGLQYSLSTVEIVDGPLKDVDIDGKSQSYGVNITHPFILNERWRVEGILEFTKQKSQTDFMGFEWINDDITKYTAGITITNFRNSSIIYNRHNFSKGKWDSISGNSKDYTKYDTTFMYQLMCRTNQMLTLRFNGQYAFDDYLPSTDQFYVGGAYSVRGYPESFMGADHGASLNIEYSFPFWKKGELFVFLDGGILEGENAFDNNSIYSAGIGYRVNIGNKVYLSSTIGIPFEKDFEEEGMKVDSLRAHLAINYQF